MTENEWDKLLKIKTSGRDDTDADAYRYPYEPTPYMVLERLAKEGYISKDSVLLDYGCGKGRVDFFLSYQTKCRSIGIEYNPRIYERAVQNQGTAISAGRVTLLCVDAKDYPVPSEVNRIFFFNPFSVELLQSVYRQILDSYYDCPRQIRLFFYFPSAEYIAFLMQEPLLSFVDEIDCSDLFEGNAERERILIFEMR